MNVLVVEPGYQPYEKEINGLHEMQAVVGGLIQAIYPYEEPVALVCNDEGILQGLRFNRSVEGGSGSGKTRYVVKPNLMLANTSYIVTDPKAELLRSVAPLLLERGYAIRVFDLIDPSHSDCYNPFCYIRTDADVFRLIGNLIQNTTPKDAHSNDPFWESAETALDSALMLYLLHEAPPEEQTMEMVLTMIEYGSAREDDDDYKSPLDLLFEALAEEQPEHIALRQYRVFKQAAGETAPTAKASSRPAATL